MMPLIINGEDFSSLANQRKYVVSYEKRSGNNGGMMLDGSLTEDVLAIKAIITWTLDAMTAPKLQRLLAQVGNADSPYVIVTFFDARLNSERTAEFIPSIGEINYAFSRNSLAWFRDGIVLTLRER